MLIVDGRFSADASQKVEVTGYERLSADHREQTLMVVEMVVGQELCEANSAASERDCEGLVRLMLLDVPPNSGSTSR